MSTLKVNAIEPYSGGTVSITGGTVDNATSASYAENADALTAGNKSINGNLSVTGSATVTGVANFGDDVKLDRGVSGNAALFLNPDFLSDYYGQFSAWAPNLNNGMANLWMGEKALAEIYVNAFSGSYDNVLKIAADSEGAFISDWDLPSYGNAKWLKIPQGGTPAFQRGLDITGSLNVSGSGASNQWTTDWPTNFNQKNITTFDGFTAGNGAVYNNNFQRITNYGSFGNGLEGLVTSFNDSGDSNYYSSFWFGPNTAYWTLSPSGSNGQESLIKLETDSGAATTTVTLQADTVDINGPVTLDQTLKLTPQDPLPSGTVGELAVSGSNLYFYNGAWTQVV
jgi:hypothetical protein